MRSTTTLRTIPALMLLGLFAAACDDDPAPLDDAGADASTEPPTSCGDDGDCTGGQICEAWPMMGFVCQTPCDTSTTWICADGAVCTGVFGRPVCFGGVMTTGDSCFANVCPRGETCVGTDPDTRCAVACVPSDGSRCDAPLSCTSTGDDRGYCE